MKQSISKLKVIINADDFGTSYGVNKAIADGFTKGILTSASIRTNGPAFADAVKLHKGPLKKMGLGLHLNLTDGIPHIKNFSYSTFFLYLLQTQRKNKKLLAAVEQELEEQFLITKKSGLKIDHVDGQDHIQMVPAICEVICRLCKKYNCRSIRISCEPWWTLPVNSALIKNLVLRILSYKIKKIVKQYHLYSTEAYYGVLQTSNMSIKNIRAIITDAQKRALQSIELALHPGYPKDPKDVKFTSDFFRYYSQLPARRMEADALLDKPSMNFIRRAGVLLTDYRLFSQLRLPLQGRD